jgi:hypothetical protein
MADEPAHGLPRRPASKMDRASEPENRKPEAELPFEAAMPQEMRIDSAIDDGEA